MADADGRKRRFAADAEGDAAQKRARPAEAAGAGAPAAGAGATSVAAAAAKGPSLETLEKAKRALQMQRELAAKLKALPQLAGRAPAAAPGAAPVAPGAAAALPPPGLTPSQLAARQKALALAGQISQRIGMPQPPPAAAPLLAPPAAAAAPARGYRPAPLVLDAEGRPIEDRAPGAPTIVQVTTFKVNAEIHRQKEAEAAAAEAAAAAAAHVDPTVPAPALERKRKGALEFLRPGSVQRQAERLRQRGLLTGDKMAPPAVLVEAARQRRLEARLAREAADGARLEAAGADGQPTMDANSVPLGVRPPAPEPMVPKAEVPAVEWWDVALLADPSAGYGPLAAAPGGRGPLPALRADKLTLYVEHPVPLEPPAEAPAPPPQPLMLTTKERKKLRKQRREAREKERRDMIRQGLLEPPKPKVKISNLMRVMGAEAVLDPTRVEGEVRGQMAERQMAHDDRNLARKLTPAELKAKRLRKLFGSDAGATAVGAAGALETHVAVFRVGALPQATAEDRRLLFKVDYNAIENKLSGVSVDHGPFGLVVVEGGAKGLKRYKKLMLRRIDWAAAGREDGAGEEDEEGEDDDDGEGGGGGGGGRGAPNYCRLAWEGTAKAPAFTRFKHLKLHSEAALRKLFADAGVPQYYDLAARLGAGEEEGGAGED